MHTQRLYEKLGVSDRLPPWPRGCVGGCSSSAVQRKVRARRGVMLKEASSPFDAVQILLPMSQKVIRSR